LSIGKNTDIRRTQKLLSTIRVYIILNINILSVGNHPEFHVWKSRKM